MHPAWIEIDIAQLKKNLALIKTAIGSKVRLCLPIKANAYGHGLVPVARAIANMVDYLAVAHVTEAVQLREAKIETPILVLGAIHDEQIGDLLSYNLDFTLSSAYKARLVANWCEKLRRVARVHLEVDTGMRRTGMRPETATSLYAELKKNRCFHVVGIYSHLATGSSPSDVIAHAQIDAFSAMLHDPVFVGENLIRHLANSTATQYLLTSYFDMVRPAMLCFGYRAPSSPDKFCGIKPCFSLKARVSYFKVIEAGEGISYGHTHTARERTRVVTVPVGYGDGYRRALSNRGEVLIGGKRYPIIGTVCMDQFMVDVGTDSVFVGDEVVLIGEQGPQSIGVNDIATLCETIPYEILCLFNERIPRKYLNEIPSTS